MIVCEAGFRMRFSRLRPLFMGCVGFLVLGSSCGLLGLGEKKPSDSTFLPGNNIGCYDQLGPRVRRYFNGDIEEPEWLATFDCVKDQVGFFRKYVRGAVPNGYNQPDIAAMIRRFLIVNRPVSDAFIASIFDLKASVFGGEAVVITHADLEEFLRLNEILRVQSVKILPLLKARRANPSGENLLKLADEIAAFGDKLAKYLEGLSGTVGVRKESFIPFARELLALNGGDPTLVDQYGDFVRNLKVVISGGSPEIIEKNAWSILVREGAAFGGLLFAYRDMEDQSFVAREEQDQFMVDLARRAQVAMNRVISIHGTGIPLELFDPVIDTLPWDSLSPEKRIAIKTNLRQIVYRTLQSKVSGWLNARAVANAIDFYESGMRAQIHLDKIYASLPNDAPSKKDFEASARRYLSGISDAQARKEVLGLIEIGHTYIGLFPEDSGQMVFTNAMRETRTRNHMIRMNWFRRAITYLFSVYATGPESSPGHKAARAEDLAELVSDLLNILQEWKLAKKTQTPIEMARKRFREANLFMPISNGNKVLDDVEGTYYFAFLFSSGAFSGTVYRTIVNEWRMCETNQRDELDQPAMAAECFRRAYFGHTDIFWSTFPGLQVAYSKMTPDERAELAHSMEQAARTGGYNQNPIGPFDIDSFSALPHYVEDIMENFDADDDEKLDRREILNRAYPIFKQTLSDVAGSRSDFVLKGVLTYIIYYGKAPPKESVKFLLWCAKMPFVKIEAERNDLYRIVALLSSPLERGKKTTGPAWPLDYSSP
jgi:hypothetical protein